MKLWQEVRREGKILDRVDVEDQSGVHSEFWVELGTSYYYCKMTNGQVITLLQKQEIFGYYYRGFFYFKDVMPNLSYNMWTDAKPTCARISVEWLNKWRWKVEFVNDLIVNSPERNWKEMI